MPHFCVELTRHVVRVETETMKVAVWEPTPARAVLVGRYFAKNNQERWTPSGKVAEVVVAVEAVAEQLLPVSEKQRDQFADSKENGRTLKALDRGDGETS